ncbi:ATP-binding cassette domain-containing protein [Enterococcus mundtii]|uniref:ATP-binding cassette domain-containing protein n=1 Tax=Enterococcus mundtii TaxID=53346 RepID=UPI000824A72D|nr:ATP-binding cassette domain-containing protein [Enterococcus mundtii]
MAFLEIKEVTVERKKQRILNEVTISAELGDVVGFIGQNGSGKTMLFKAICGFIRLSKGKIKVGEETIGKEVDFPSHTGMLIENPGFIGSMTGFDNLYSLSLLTDNVKKAEIVELLTLVGLLDKQKVKVANYSLGMKQRLGIAQALMGDPTMIILDEPFNGLDNQGIELLIEIIEELKLRNKLVLLISHRNEDLQRVCTKFYQVDRGSFSRIEVSNDEKK